MSKMDFKKAEEPEIKVPTSIGSWKKQGKHTKKYTSHSLIMLKPLTVWITTNCEKNLKEMGIPDHLTCFLRNLYAGQEATVRIRHGTTVQFNSVAQSCPTLGDPMDCSMPGFPVDYQLLELTQTNVHGVNDTIQPTHPLPSPSPSTFNLFQHQGLFK